MGKSADLAAGGFAEAPARMNHFAWTKSGAVVQVSADGPFAMTYVNLPTIRPTPSVLDLKFAGAGLLGVLQGMLDHILRIGLPPCLYESPRT